MPQKVPLEICCSWCEKGPAYWYYFLRLQGILICSHGLRSTGWGPAWWACYAVEKVRLSQLRSWQDLWPQPLLWVVLEEETSCCLSRGSSSLIAEVMLFFPPPPMECLGHEWKLEKGRKDRIFRHTEQSRGSEGEGQRAGARCSTLSHLCVF